jgi:hypothetical protein
MNLCSKCKGRWSSRKSGAHLKSSQAHSRFEGGCHSSYVLHPITFLGGGGLVIQNGSKFDVYNVWFAEGKC